MRRALLDAATAGLLTADGRISDSADSAQQLLLEKICAADRVITYGVIKLGDDLANGVPCPRTSNVRWLRLETEGMRRIHPRVSTAFNRTVLQGGEVLVNVRGTLGGVVATDASMAGWNVSREVAVVPVDPALVNAEFIALLIASDTSQNWLSDAEKGVAYTGINIKDLRNLPLRLPSLEEQADIVRRVRSLFNFIDRIEARLQTAQAVVARLGPAFLAKAFRGELVPQDPGEHTTAELLLRLQEPLAELPLA